jgi:DNA-binding NarL/FixJ family response regulator
MLEIGWRNATGDVLAVHVGRFTRRQQEILTLVADGLSNAEIASRLGISRRTVDKHLEAIHMRAGTTTRARLVAFATSLRRD